MRPRGVGSMEWSRRGKHVLEGARISPHFCAVRTRWAATVCLVGPDADAQVSFLSGTVPDGD